MAQSKEWFGQYFESSYTKGNIITKEQYEKACTGFDQVYKDLLPEDKQAKILDVGCGTGHFLYYLKKKGYRHSFGIDISSQQVGMCQSEGLLNSKVADVFYFLKDDEEKYDLISAHDVLEHFEKREILPLVQLIYRSLKPGGIFIVRVPNMSNPFSVDSRYRDMTHEVGFTGKSLYQTLWIGGFQKIKILPPKRIAVNSFRNFIRKLMVELFHRLIRFAFFIQDFKVPENLDKTISAVSIKR